MGTREPATDPSRASEASNAGPQILRFPTDHSDRFTAPGRAPALGRRVLEGEASRRSARILIVEDESIVAEDIRVGLEHMGYEVCGVVASGEGALKELDGHTPDLVLMDVALAGPLDGVQTAEEVRRRFRIPVVYLTAHADDDTLRRAGVTEPFGFIVKPFRRRDLRIVIEIGLYRAKIEAERQRAEEALRASEGELSVRSKVAQAFLTALDGDVYGDVLQVLLEATESPCGLFGYVDDAGSLVCPSISRNAWTLRERVPGDLVLARQKWAAPWRRALCESRTICSEEGRDAQPGQVPVEREVCAPLSHGGDALGLICVANRATPYSERDRRLMEAIAAYIAPILHARLQRDRQSQARRQAEDALRDLRRQLTTEHSFAGIVGRDPRMLDLFETIRELARVDASVLLHGESGTGKELVALAIHGEGPRADKAFVPVNCGALPETLLESELFGHCRGAFTGAIREKKGRFELAQGGTIFLDEVGEISASMQVKLLRVLQEGTFERLGGEQTIQADVRVISATNKDLPREIAAGRFREDLFYRLSVVPVHLPPLRERRGDIPLLAHHILRTALAARGLPEVSLAPETLAAMTSYGWPGNVRELQNAIQYALVKFKGEILEVSHLPPEIGRASEAEGARGRTGRAPKLRVEDVLRVLEECQGNKAAAARRLGVTRATLYKYLGP
ncbi:MAG: sigma 54-interacting transcriptional regulator [Planctomycetes bacterium]|nr:sigma 54-interacting transcriptional regulator [Planctomycetota bacterium]